MPTPAQPIARPFANTPHGMSFQVPIQSFLDYALPPLRRDLDPEKIIKKMVDTGMKSSHRPITLQDRWRGSPVDPAFGKGETSTVFGRMEDVISTTIQASRPSAKDVQVLPFVFRDNHAGVFSSLDRKTDMFPDAYWQLDTVTECSWSTIAVSGEYKKGESESDQQDNVVKVTSSMHNCLRKDPCRRFTLGFTIENTTMRLWYCDRSQIVCSEPFNPIIDCRWLVHFCLSIAYAEPHHLGWDPTMRQTEDGRYDISVYSSNGALVVYRTLELLSRSGVEALKGRGTRVWKAVRVDDGVESGTPMVLKDTWVDPDRESEGAVLEKLRNAERKPDLQRFVDRTFLSREWDGDVFLDRTCSVLDCTRVFGSRAVISNRQDLRSRFEDASGTTAPPTQPRHASDCKIHYRIIFRDVCTPITKETSLVTIFRALAQITVSLQLMHAVGWVHRDVSTGNILLAKDGTARLADLEYARLLGQGDECRLGTTKFMAIEVDHQKYWFPEQRSLSAEHDDRGSTKAVPAVREGAHIQSTSPGLSHKEHSSGKHKHPKFRYNPLHDLESVWWVAVHFMFTREAVNNSLKVLPEEPGARVSEGQRLYADEFFTSRNSRGFAMILDGSFATAVEALDPSVQDAGAVLEKIRRKLVAFYRKAEGDLSSVEYAKCADGLHAVMMDLFLDVAESPDLQDIHLRPLRPSPPARAPDKRSHAFGDGVDETDPLWKLLGMDKLRSEDANEGLDEPPAEQPVISATDLITKTGRRKAKSNLNAVRTRPYLPRKAKAVVKPPVKA
ncbi:hypothetical protein NM688_g1546 [Phlebia brevispora]|uniref:Uncharacterized protein n=1 Tax=Phlebia brevispora TaxID=194682 RepID=A0ACC1TB17_9APHY|nr:hypothetical protein NM688_g1546 [Phlebia brevispora]